MRGTAMVPGAGFEPARAKTHYPLKIACLPIPPARLERNYTREGGLRQRVEGKFRIPSPSREGKPQG